MEKSYSSIIKSNIDSVYHTGIANKILQHMDRIRNVSDDGQARRWVMELLQNCSDTAYEGQTVDVRISLCEDRLVFEHNGKPFRVKDILSIINQVSSKNPNENTVGRFGTGFMSTFRLSEEVTIKSVLRDIIEDGNGGFSELPYRFFEVTLDRRGHSKEEVLESIAASMRQLDNVDLNELEGEFDPRAFNTSFTYKLYNDESRSCARIGVDDLKNTVKYILLFAPTIESVSIINELEGEEVTFRRGRREEVSGSVEKLEISEIRGEAVNKQKLVFLTDGDLTLAASCTEEGKFNAYDENTPRVFTIFPLVGTEKFPFPVIINSFSFRPNEPRNNITLVDNANSVDAVHNKELIDRAVVLYESFLRGILDGGFSKLENIVRIPEWHEDKEMSEVFVKEHIYSELAKIISKLPLIETDNGYLPISHEHLYIIDGKDKEEKERLKTLTGCFNNFIVPSGDESWNEALANYSLSPEKFLTAEMLFRNAKSYLEKHFTGETEELIKWCSDLCGLSKNDEMLLTMLRAGEAALYPPQDTDDLKALNLRTINSIYYDPDIPEILKDVSEKLDKLDAEYDENNLNIRSRLLNRAFETEGVPVPPVFEVTKLTSFISERSNRLFTVRRFMAYKNQYLTAWYEAWSLMMSCVEDKSFYDVCQTILGGILPPYTRINESYYENHQLWYNSKRNIFISACEQIEKTENIKGLTEYLKLESENKAYELLSEFINSAKVNGCPVTEIENHFLPDLYGNFVSLSATEGIKYTDNLKYPELYDIASAFAKLSGSYDVGRYTIDRRINLSAFNLPCMTDSIVSDKINSALLKVFSEGPLCEACEEYQMACTELLAWIQKDTVVAAEFFPNYVSEEDKMKLLTPKSAAIMQRKLDKCDELLKKYNCTSIEELEEKMSAMSPYSTDNIYYSNEYDVLLDGGDYSYDEYISLCRKIGNAGERFLFDYLADNLKSKGYTVTSETENEVVLIRLSNGKMDKAIVIRGDHSGITQSGWDVCVKRVEDDEKKIEYYEVKTHTNTSVVRNEIRLSNEQMKMAMLHSDNYYVVIVSCNKNNYSCTLKNVYDNIGKCIIEGKFRNPDGYSFIVK